MLPNVITVAAAAAAVLPLANAVTPPPSGLVRPSMPTQLSCYLLLLNDRPPRPLFGNQHLIGLPPEGAPHQNHARDNLLYHMIKTVSPSPFAAIFVVVIVIVVVAVFNAPPLVFHSHPLPLPAHLALVALPFCPQQR
jgi:hypothetical protein